MDPYYSCRLKSIQDDIFMLTCLQKYDIYKHITN